MNIAIKLILFSSLAGVLVFLGSQPARSRWMQILRSILILTVALAPLALDHRPRTIVQSMILLIILGLERLFQRNPYEFSSDEHFQSATYNAILRALYLAIGYFWLDRLNGSQVPWGLTAHHAPVWLQAIVIFFAVDLLRYCTHRLQHGISWWWEFHKIHHATLEVSAFASGRGHFLDNMTVILLLPTFLAYLLGVRAEVFLFASQVPAVLIASAFAHANLDFPKTKSWWAYILSSPNSHSLHHTKIDDRKNFGNTTLIWDWLFGTIAIPKAAPSDFGVMDPEIAKMNIFEQSLHPFVAAAKRISGRRIHTLDPTS